METKIKKIFNGGGKFFGGLSFSALDAETGLGGDLHHGLL